MIKASQVGHQTIGHMVLGQQVASLSHDNVICDAIEPSQGNPLDSDLHQPQPHLAPLEGRDFQEEEVFQGSQGTGIDCPDHGDRVVSDNSFGQEGGGNSKAHPLQPQGYHESFLSQLTEGDSSMTPQTPFRESLLSQQAAFSFGDPSIYQGSYTPYKD